MRNVARVSGWLIGAPWLRCPSPTHTVYQRVGTLALWPNPNEIKVLHALDPSRRKRCSEASRRDPSRRDVTRRSATERIARGTRPQLVGLRCCGAGVVRPPPASSSRGVAPATEELVHGATASTARRSPDSVQVHTWLVLSCTSMRCVRWLASTLRPRPPLSLWGMGSPRRASRYIPSICPVDRRLQWGDGDLRRGRRLRDGDAGALPDDPRRRRSISGEAGRPRRGGDESAEGGAGHVLRRSRKPPW